MNENENIAIENIAENVDVTTEESTVREVPEKVYTEAEFKERLGGALDKKTARLEAKIRKEYEKKYGELENVLRAGTGKQDVSEMADAFKQYYQQKGIQIPTEPTYSDRDIAVLAKAEAEDIINSGFEDVVEETDRLASLGVDKMNAREKALFKELAEYRQNAERGKELLKIGVTEDVYGSKEFRDFAAKFSSSTPITEVFDIYSKMQPKKEIRTMGSMKSGAAADKGVKDFYTRDEALQFTKKDFDNNPELFKAVEKSMLKW